MWKVHAPLALADTEDGREVDALPLNECAQEDWIGKATEPEELPEAPASCRRWTKGRDETHSGSREIFWPSLKTEPPTGLWRCCSVFTRMMGMLAVIAAAAFLVVLHFDASNRHASVGTRMTFAFNMCWPQSNYLNYRCDWQIALGFQYLYELQFKDIIAIPTNVSNVSMTGRWEGDYLVAFELTSLEAAMAFEEILSEKLTEEELLEHLRENFHYRGFPGNFIGGLQLRSSCVSADVVDAKLVDAEVVQNPAGRDLAMSLTVKVPRCMYSLEAPASEAVEAV
eukprot:s1614_g4.t1